MRFYWFIVFLILMFLRAARGEEVSLSLDRAQSEGLDHSPVALQARSAREEARAQSHVGFSGLIPRFDLKAKHDFTAQYESVPVVLNGLDVAVPVVFPRTAVGVEARWTIFDGLANLRHYQATLDSYHASEHESTRREFEVDKQIELAFFRALAARRFEEVAAENVKTLQESLAQIRLRERNGVSTEYDVLRVEVQLSDAQTEWERTQDEVTIQRRRLAQAMGLAADERPLTGELPQPVLLDRIQTLTLPDPSQREDYQAARLRSDSAAHEASAAWGALVPAISLGAQYEKYEDSGYPGQAYGGFRDAWSVGVTARWSLFDGGATLARSQAEGAHAQRAEQAYREAVLNLPADFELWKRRYVYSAHRFAAKGQDVKRSAESFRISTVSFHQGRKTITDVLEAETDLFRARAGVVQALLDAEEARVQLELTIGKGIQ